jgi:hypothetical protein
LIRWNRWTDKRFLTQLAQATHVPAKPPRHRKCGNVGKHSGFYLSARWNRVALRDRLLSPATARCGREASVGGVPGPTCSRISARLQERERRSLAETPRGTSAQALDRRASRTGGITEGGG